MDLNKLPCKLHSQLRSDLVARNVSNCVIELIENALDANASCIAIRINFETFRIEVVDNGTGMSKEDLKLVGERYFTSKRTDIAEANQISKNFGSRGEGLASIKNVSSRVLIVSRAFDEDVTYCKIINGSNAEVEESEYDRKTIGTTVIVENFLDKLPVRQRCIKSSEELQIIKWYLQATALMFPKVNFSLRNDGQKSEIFRIERTNSTASTFVELFPGAVKDSSSFLKLKTTHENVTVKMMLSKESCDTDQLQFIFVNKRYLPQCEVQKYLNNLLNRIDSSRKKISRRIVYIVNLSCPREDYEISYETNRRCIEFGNWIKVEQCLVNLVKLIIGDEKFCKIQQSTKKLDKSTIEPKDAFKEMNTAHTVFGLPANRKIAEKPIEVYDIDDKSNSSNDVQNKIETKISKLRAVKSRTFRVSKAFRRISKKTKPMKSPRLIDQGALITYLKSPGVSKSARDEAVQKCTENRDNFRCKVAAPQGEYAWMWKHPNEDHDSDSTEFSGSQQAVDKSRVIPSKSTKNKKLITEKKREAFHKSMVDLSNQRALHLPKRDRISKKQNHYFDAAENNKNYVIEKYGKIYKNAQYDCEDTLITDDLDTVIRIGNGAQWTAKISTKDDKAIPPPVTLFDKQSSLELEFKDEPARQTNELIAKQHHSPVRTSHLHDDQSADRLPMRENRRNHEPNHRPSDNLLFESPKRELLKYDHIANVEILDTHCKVSQWISKLPPNEDTVLGDSAKDYITPVNNPYLTDQIADEFKRKTRLSKNRDDDSQSLERTPEKRKSTQENFEPKCKLKLNFDKAQIEEYKMKRKMFPKREVNAPVYQCNPKPLNKISQDNDHLPNNAENNHMRDEINLTQNDNKSVDEENYDLCNQHMSRSNLKDSTDFFKDDHPSQLEKTQPVSTQISDCSSQCQCKCHKKLKLPRKLPTDPFRLCTPTQIITRQHVSQEDENDSVILINSENSQDDNYENNTFIEPQENLNISEYHQLNVESNSCKIDEDEIVQSQHFFENSNDANGSEYFRSKIELVEKLKFKMNSKFLENNSAIDIPKGMLEIGTKCGTNIERLDEDEKKAVVDLVKPYKMQKHITLDDFGNSCLRIFPMLKNPSKKLENDDSEDLNCPVMFTKEDIPSFKFIAQIENKFILASAIIQSTQTAVLILLDQHAVDERIRVERLLRDYTEHGVWQSTPVNPPIHLSIPSNFSSLFTDYRSNLEEFGLYFEFNNRTKNNEAKLFVSFTKVPTCFYNRAMRESNNFQNVLRQLIQALTKEMLKKCISEGALVHTVPNELQNVVNYEACRGAVKFGDKLTSQVCSALLEGMVQCKLPFQCAHGRPSVIPLVSFDKLVHLQKPIWVPNLKSLKECLINLKK